MFAIDAGGQAAEKWEWLVQGTCSQFAIGNLCYMPSTLSTVPWVNG
jgi:hypothetical protein